MPGETDPAAHPHYYLSTACAHDLHSRCRLTCKFCHEACLCLCHYLLHPPLPE